MIYECLIATEAQRLIAAQPSPGDWLSGERSNPPFEIVKTGNLEPTQTDYDETLHCSFGDLIVKKSQIDPALVTE
jgi:hypothetical protein